MKTIVIPAAGLGSRLSSFTKNYSKAMCTLGPKPIISYIIDKFDNDDEIIILLGYKGDLLRQVVSACHPEKNITFVEVDNFEGPGSGLGYSLHCAYDKLQKPFIFWSCDTVLESFDVNEVSYDENWAVASNTIDKCFNEYRHFRINNKKYVIDILPKDVKYAEGILPYVGVSFIKDYKDFWKSYEMNSEAFVKDGETFGLRNLKKIKCYESSDWLDMGNKSKFEYWKDVYNQKMEATILEKPDEAIWFVNGKVIKFHISEKFIADRVMRFETLLSYKQIKAGIVLPELISYTKNTYTYKMAPGIIASKVINNKMLDDILEKYLSNVDTVELDDNAKYDIVADFYIDKTLSRITKYCTEYTDIDNECYINGILCKPAAELVKKIDWEKLSKNGVFTYNYHGDFHLENILVNNDEYIMLDFRQNFGKSTIGDVYYDIAKMWHSFIVNHEMVKNNLFTVENTDANHVKIDIHRTFIDTECEKTLIDWLDNSKYDRGQAELMTAIIFLNIAACHVYPYSKFLFNLGKLMINNFYNKSSNKQYFK